MQDETVWLTQQQLAELYQTSRTNVSEHIRHIYEEGELEESSTCRNFRQVRVEGKRQVIREIPYYNLDLIISLGYRVKSKVATRFRRWATERLKEYMIKGFTMDDERLKKLGGGGYFKELLERIRDIRASEKVFYRQILDIYATSIDYDPKAEISIQFFQKVQNKIHYAIHGETAAEVIYHRADASDYVSCAVLGKPHLPLTILKGSSMHEFVLLSLMQRRNILGASFIKRLRESDESFQIPFTSNFSYSIQHRAKITKTSLFSLLWSDLIHKMLHRSLRTYTSEYRRYI